MLEKLGELVKVKLPNLSHIPDEELGLAYYNLELRPRFFPKLGTAFLNFFSKFLHEREQEWIETQFRTYLREEQRLYEAAYQPVNLQLEQAVKQTGYQAQIELNVLQSTLSKISLANGYSVAALDSIRVDQEASNTRIQEHEAKARIDLDMHKEKMEFDFNLKKEAAKAMREWNSSTSSS